MNQNSQIIRYIQENRASVMAIDPPATGVSEIPIRSAVVPILPLDDIHNTCGKLHLVNICISDKVFIAFKISFIYLTVLFFSFTKTLGSNTHLFSEANLSYLCT
jgi:hypothetical protein